MSVDRMFTISFAKSDSANLSAEKIINCFLDFGWSLYSSQGEIIYTGLGDSDDFEYLTERISKIEYLNIAKQKELQDEVIAFSLFFEENSSRYRINVLIVPKFQIVISPSDGTRKMSNPTFGILDVNWYLSKILPPFLNANVQIEAYSFQQY